MGKCEYERDEREKIKQSREQEFEEKTQNEMIRKEKFREKRYQMMNEEKTYIQRNKRGRSKSYIKVIAR